MKDYYITKYYESHKDYCLEYTCGTDEQHAKQVLARVQADDPNGKYRLESSEYSKNWWNQGWLD